MVVANTIAPTISDMTPRCSVATARTTKPARASSSPTPWLTLLAISSPSDCGRSMPASGSVVFAMQVVDTIAHDRQRAGTGGERLGAHRTRAYHRAVHGQSELRSFLATLDRIACAPAGETEAQCR